jgi:glycosyltransferase involved in cell wall biosynthesis
LKERINLQGVKTVSQPVLSINIPTYNRPKEFERMLAGLLPQLTAETEIVVRDDSSNLESKEMFERLVGPTGIRYQYFKGEKIGLDAAAIFMLEKSEGTFIWTLSDDDVLLEGAISEVLRLIKSNDRLNLIWANYDTEAAGLAIKNRASGYFKDKNEALEVIGPNIGLISTQIYRRKIGIRGIPAAKKYLRGSSFVSTCIYLSVMAGDGESYFLAGPYLYAIPTTIEEIKTITTKTGKIVNEAFDVFGLDFYKVVREFDGKFKRKSIKKMLVKNFSHVWRGMLVAWVGGWDTPSGKRWRMFKYFWDFPEYWIAMPLFLLPLSVNKALYRVYKIFFSHRKFVFGKK